MNDTANNVIDARLSEALGTYFNGVTLQRTVGDCAILSGVRKQNGAPVSIYTPSFSVARDEAVAAEIGKAFAVYDKIGSPRLQATERLLTSRAFKKTPALAVLSCPVAVFDEAFDTLPVDARLALFDQVLEGLSALHEAGLVHGNLSPDVVRRETEGGIARLCELTFSGARSTTVTSQPPAYQSRHVINTTQPRAEDDVHAAGMLGYRILLGPDGPARALTGEAAEPEAVLAAILGEPRDPLTADDLFPGGHEKSDQIARLLARMVGQLPNAAPYSNASAARRAFQTVLSGRSAPEPVAEFPTAAPVVAEAVPQAVAVRSRGVSAATAITLFAGFLASTTAACYFFLAHSDAVDSASRMERQFQLSANRFERIGVAQTALRDADRTIATGRASGAAMASADARAAIEAAMTTLADGDLRLQDAPDEAGEAAMMARGQAEQALALLKDARAAAEAARDQAEAIGLSAALAAEAGDTALTSAHEVAQAATTAFGTGAFEEAAALWSQAAGSFSAVVEEARGRADMARDTLETANAEASGTGAVLAKTYMKRAERAYEAGRFSEAAALYEAGLAALGATRSDASAPVAEVRQVRLGDTPDALAAAVGLCREEAPIDPTNCPASRPEGERARQAEVTPYALDATEVSVGEFRAFVEGTGHVTEAESAGRIVALTSSGEARLIDGGYSWALPNGAGSEADATPDRPVTNIALSDARAYCDWAGGRVPSEAEWEAAARGDAARAFPWGAWRADAPVWRGASRPERRLPTAVDAAGGASEGGHQGLSGNVREWVLGADGAVLKGGSWNTANPADLRISARLIVPGNAPGVDFGFRCARDLEAWP